jgi:nucleoside 2-deoxyribosyltransferase
MYGGLAWVPDRVYVYSLFTQDAIGEKEKLIYDLQENGYDVLSPWHDKVYQNITEYNGTKDWVYDATVWAIQNGYH